jgi:hypothetical protein
MAEQEAAAAAALAAAAAAAVEPAAAAHCAAEAAEEAALAASNYGQTGPAGPPTGAVAYPYYTTRGPRDFLAKNPPSIGP